MDLKDVGASGPVDGWLELAIAALDAKFGDGYARANPALVGAYVQACALESIRTALHDEVTGALEDIKSCASGIVDAIAGHE